MHLHFVLSIFFALAWPEEPPIVYDILYGGWYVYQVSNPVGTLGVPIGSPIAHPTVCRKKDGIN